MYSFVFATRASLMIVLFLLFSFFIQPVHLAYANEATIDAENQAIAEAAAETEAQPPADGVQMQESEEEMEEDVTVEPEVVSEPETDEEVTPEADGDVSPEGSQDSAADGSNAEVSDGEQAGVDGVDTDTSPADESEFETATSTGDVIEESELDNSDTATTTESGADETGDNDDTNATSSVPTGGSDDGATASTTDTDGEDTAQSGGGSAGSDGSSDTATTSDSETDVETETATSSDSDNSDSSSDDDSQESSEQIATSTPVTEEVVTTVEYIVTDENFYQFNKQSCVSVGEGSYHCSMTEEAVVDSKAVVYSETGPGGSPEIFIRAANGDVEQITDNNFEDSSPHFDAVSQRITWQRLVQGRYQIVIYDLQTGKEKQLTFSRTNNMEPSVSDAGVVWQAWDNNDWEIMFYDGTYTDQLTDNATQDVAPVMEDDYIIWTVIGADEQYAQVYSFETEEIVTISNHDGGSILNPRFVLVYDTQFDNGDVITQRFDPETGFAEAIAAQPAEAPVEIPVPDTAGEVKALITTKSTSKQITVEDTAGDGSVGDGNSATTTSDTLNLIETHVEATEETVATTSDGTIDAGSVTVDDADSETEYFELTEFDLILPDTKTASTGAAVSITNASSTDE